MSEGLLEPETAVLDSQPALTTAGPVCLPDAPDWLVEKQALAWSRYQTTNNPARSDQPWRFNSLKVASIDSYGASTEVEGCDAEALIARSNGIEGSAGKLTFANGRLLEHNAIAAELEAQGVLFLPLDQAMQSYGDLVQKHCMSQPVQLGSEKFAALHESQLRSGTFIYIPKNVSVSMPLESFHWLSGENASSFPHTLLIAERGSKVTFVEYFESQDPEAEGFACGVNDLFVGDGATVRYISVQNWGSKVKSIQLNSTVVEKDGAAINLGVHLGGARNRSESVSRLVGSGGRSDMLAVTVAAGDQEFDQRTLQDHIAASTYSDLLYKNALLDQARTIFSGLIKVEPHAHKTDAYQKVRNLMLSDEAEANSMPGLEILADEVRCSHGATSGYIDPSEFFYFMARGIPASTARKLLVAGFLGEVIERLGDQTVGAKLTSIIEDRFR